MRIIIKWKHLGAYVAGWFALWLPWKLRDMSLGLKGRYFDTITIANVWQPEAGKIDTVGGFLDKFQTNFYDTVIKGFSDVTFPFIHTDNVSTGLMWVFGLLILALTFYGAWKTGKYRWLFLGYFVANIGIFLLWHGGNGARYVRPLAPFILFCILWGGYQLLTLVNKKVVPYIVPALVVIFIGSSFSQIKELNVMAKNDYHPAYKNYFAIAKAIKKQKLDDVTVICRKPDIFYFYAECYVANYLFTSDDQKLIADMVNKKADFVVMEQLGYGSTQHYLYPAINKHLDLFGSAMTVKNPDTYLLRFNREAAEKMLNTPETTEAQK